MRETAGPGRGHSCTLDEYASVSDDIASQFEESVEEWGLSFEETESFPRSKRPKAREEKAREAAGDANAASIHTGDGRKSVLHCENDDNSFWQNWISPACIACRTGEGTETFFPSLRCNRDCFFCFNPNQEEYDYFCTHVRDIAGELEERHAQGAQYQCLAVTGGEPLMFMDRVRAFLETAGRLYPDAHLRLYTNGDLFTPALGAQLRDAGLDEIRFSIKTDAGNKDDIARQVETVASAVGIIPDAMVEMPVMPDKRELMEQLLVSLDRAGVRGINLLELGYPFNNAPEFERRGYRLRRKPFKTLYNYWYAGGLPIAGSEMTCFELMEFARRKSLSLGIHYCSFDNKNTGQVYQQNMPHATAFPWCHLDSRDHFLKSLKAFGKLAGEVEGALAAEGADAALWRTDADFGFVEFNPGLIAKLPPDLACQEMGLCFHVVEPDEDGTPLLKEVRVDRVVPATLPQNMWE